MKIFETFDDFAESVYISDVWWNAQIQGVFVGRKSPDLNFGQTGYIYKDTKNKYYFCSHVSNAIAGTADGKVFEVNRKDVLIPKKYEPR